MPLPIVPAIVPAVKVLTEHPLAPAVVSFTGTSFTTALAEGLTSPKAVGLFYWGVAKSCHGATGSKLLACGLAAGACGFALVPGPHQGPFIVACVGTLRGVNRL